MYLHFIIIKLLQFSIFF